MVSPGMHGRGQSLVLCLGQFPIPLGLREVQDHSSLTHRPQSPSQHVQVPLIPTSGCHSQHPTPSRAQHLHLCLWWQPLTWAGLSKPWRWLSLATLLLRVIYRDMASVLYFQDSLSSLCPGKDTHLPLYPVGHQQCDLRLRDHSTTQIS